jgi:hypothetical protein
MPKNDCLKCVLCAKCTSADGVDYRNQRSGRNGQKTHRWLGEEAYASSTTILPMPALWGQYGGSRRAHRPSGDAQGPRRPGPRRCPRPTRGGRAGGLSARRTSQPTPPCCGRGSCAWGGRMNRIRTLPGLQAGKADPRRASTARPPPRPPQSLPGRSSDKGLCVRYPPLGGWLLLVAGHGCSHVAWVPDLRGGRCAASEGQPHLHRRDRQPLWLAPPVSCPTEFTQSRLSQSSR